MKLTKLEKEILKLVVEATDGLGEETTFVYDYITKNNYDMKIARGVIGSLIKKEKLTMQDNFIYCLV